MTMQTRLIWCLTPLLVAVSAKSYEGYQVFRVQPENDQHLKLLHNIMQHKHIDFWSPIHRDRSSINVMVDSQAQHMFSWFLNNSGITYEVIINNVQSVVDRERNGQLLTARSFLGQISFSKYNRHEEINEYLDELAAIYPKIVSVEEIGKSYEGRPLKVIKISTNAAADKPIIFIDAGLHGREWIAPAQVTYIINQLVENPLNTNLLEQVDWHILPVANPDGYEFTHVDDRYWRKTRSKGEVCIGADSNRNFAFHWGGIGAEADECSDNYMGKTPFSEVENLAISNYIALHKENIKLYLTFHSFGKYILYPWGYTRDLPEDYKELQLLGDSVAKKIHGVKSAVYKVGSSTHLLGFGAGGSDDWAKGGAGIALSYTIELPGGGEWGFDLPPSEILPVVTETMAGVVEFHDYIAKKFALKL